MLICWEELLKMKILLLRLSTSFPMTKANLMTSLELEVQMHFFVDLDPCSVLALRNGSLLNSGSQ